MTKRYVLSDEPDSDEATFDLELGPVYQETISVPLPPAGVSKLIYSKLKHIGYKIVTTDLFLFNGYAAADLAFTPPGRSVKLSVELSGGQANTGTVTITGTAKGIPDTEEVLTFTEACRLFSSYYWESISKIETANLADESPKPTVKVRAHDRQGTPLVDTVRTTIKIRFENKTTEFLKAPGVLQMSEARVFTVDDFKIGDLIEYNSIKYKVEGMVTRSDLLGREAFRVLLL